MIYRTDIDGLRALAVVSVILFHLGYLPQGYLGVDVFFVISGFLITGIVYNETKNEKFSVLKFYERRIRRIIPLLLLVSLVAFLLGLWLMLPDDLENLSQGVIASNFSFNNILMYLTSSNYWDVKNDFKPLMHTWSLGIEEQFYLLYPFLFYFFKGNRLKYIKPILFVLTFVSFILFLGQVNSAAKFYFIQYRFFELSLGGICAIQFSELKVGKIQGFFLYLSLILLVFCLLTPFLNNDISVLLTIILTSVILVIGKYYYNNKGLYKSIFTNNYITYIGSISYSLYMWHQIVFAFGRYAFLEKVTPISAIILVLITVFLSIFSYYLVENTFRNKKIMKTKTVLWFTSIIFVITSGSAFYVYTIGGVVKDFPELNLYKNQMGNKSNFLSGKSNIHIQYNEDVRKMDIPFEETEMPKVLVIGNSYGRDVVNILMESDFKDNIEINYFDINRILKDETIIDRINVADYIFFAFRKFRGKDFINEIESNYNIKIDKNKIWVFGTKDFGVSNGIYYNKVKNGTNQYETYWASMKEGVLETNKRLKSEWGERYINLIELVANEQNKVRVFTTDGKFISQDTAHLTKFGAQMYASLLRNKLDQILKL